MIAEETIDRDSRPLAQNLKMSTKASAFSIAAIIGEQSMSRSSDNASPSGKFNSLFLGSINNNYTIFLMMFRLLHAW